MIGMTIDRLKVGDAAEFSKTISESDIYLYAGVTGDFNPAHIDAVYAAGTFFKKRDRPRDALRRVHFGRDRNPASRNRDDLCRSTAQISGAGLCG